MWTELKVKLDHSNMEDQFYTPAWRQTLPSGEPQTGGIIRYYQETSHNDSVTVTYDNESVRRPAPLWISSGWIRYARLLFLPDAGAQRINSVQRSTSSSGSCMQLQSKISG
ncbi:Hypothetical predicted protein [Xyrichtys novacula]|uniref:Uncharacterized protein n=1 Tax=Xyrichtys novacula TaxID=13765 RepID=A0AAV1FTL3_XYRNO|nr:Hypothetical predicted protein [Xyrichtys novacula]